MSPILREYILKGLFLGLWAYLALVHPAWETVWLVLAWTVGGLSVALLAGTVIQLLRGYRPGRNPIGFLLLVLLDNPFVIYIGLIGGLAMGLVVHTDPPESRNWLAYCALAGSILGYGTAQLRGVKDHLWRFALGAVLGGLLIYLSVSYLGELDDLKDNTEATQRLGLTLLVCLPFFYLLTLCGEAEESEIEIALFCAILGLGLYLAPQGMLDKVPYFGTKVVFLIPVILYFVYVTRWLPGLRVFKHILRGYGSLSLGRIRESLTSFGRALQLDKKNELALRGLYELHRKVDVSQLDPETIGLLNFEFCINLAQSYLVKDTAPNEKERAEALRLLDIVQQHKLDYQPKVDYLKAVAFTHQKDFDRAAGYLSRLLNTTDPVGNTEIRNRILFQGWNLALRLHPELIARLGDAELAKPGRRVEAIAAVERQLAKDPNDPVAVELRLFLYSTVTESEVIAASANGPPTEFNYDYVEQVGLALLEQNDPAKYDRGMAYLRIAGRGLPQRGPSIFRKLADVAETRGQREEAHGYLEQVKRAGMNATPAKLAPDQLAIYLETLKKLVQDASDRQDYEAAAADQRLLIEAGQEDANTLRTLAELYAKSGDVLNAILITERGLLYSKTDPDLLKKKDSYYFSVDLERVRSVREKITPWFDVPYCIAKAKLVADQREPDLDTLEWGNHLVKLARVIQPTLHMPMYLEARILLRLGQRDAALSLLEDIHEQKRGSGEEEDAWFLSVRLLADLYLNELNRPDLAIPCLKEFREYQKSGADSIFMLGMAYEAVNDIPNAIRSYELVTAYEKHPRYWDATEAVRRLKGGV